MDLETYRQNLGLTYQQLAQHCGVHGASQAHRVATGRTWPRSGDLDRILRRCKGVSADAMHARRMEYLAGLESASDKETPGKKTGEAGGRGQETARAREAQSDRQ